MRGRTENEIRPYLLKIIIRGIIMKIRIKETNLTNDNLRLYPVWEFAYGEGGLEMKMKPVLDPPPYDVSLNRLLVRATFTLKNGEIKTGYMKPINLKDTFMGHLSPVDLNLLMFTEFGRVYFWFGIHKPKRKILNKFYKWLNLPPEEIFPISVKSDVEINNGLAEGIIEGFLYCIEDEVEDFYHMKSSEIRKMI
jgi:hypothetical protein